MHVTFYVPFGRYASPSLETDLELIEQQLDAGHRVTVLECLGEMEACDLNLRGNLAKCVKCVGRRGAGLERLSQRVQVESFYRLDAKDMAELRTVPRRFEDLNQLRAYQVDGCDIGYGVLSSLVSKYRDPDLDLISHQPEVQRLVRTSLMVYRSFQRYLRENKVDRVYLFNPRFAPLRPVLRACLQAGVECISHDRGGDLQHYALYPNALPHDRVLTHRRIQDAWLQAGEDSDREHVGRAWFEERVCGKNDAWFSFVDQQEDARLPRGWSDQERNVAVMTSSEDEFVAIGESWRNPLYDSQVNGIESILRSLQGRQSSLRLYVRVHPNLAGVDNQQTRRLLNLRSSNLILIPPEDPTSSYALMQRAEKVLSFGSTAGIEAVYWGRPSILAGMSYYRDLNATYNPQSHDELVELLEADLPPKDPNLALLYGFYRSTLGLPFKHFDATDVFRGNFKGSRIRARSSHLASAVLKVARRAWRGARSA